MKTLKDLWIETGEKPFRAESAVGLVFNVAGISPNGEAVGWDDNDSPDTFDATSGSWEIAKPKPKMLYPALFKYADDYYFIADRLFETEAAAIEYNNDTIIIFIRLLTNQGIEI